MALPFYPVAYPFLRDKRQSTRIYGYAYRYFTRTRKRHILRSLVTRNQRPAEIGLPVTVGFIYGRGEIVSDFTAGRRCILIVLIYCITLCNVTVTRNSCCNSWIRKGNPNSHFQNCASGCLPR